MKYIKGFFMAWGMFSAVPCPVKVWDEDLRDYMLSMFPVMGILIGGLYLILIFLVKDLGQALRAALLAAFPWIITGFIHIDGFMDVCDAILSRRDLEGRIRILKDSVCGAFAVVSMVLLCMFQFSACFDAKLNSADYLPVVCLFCASRASAAIAVKTMKPISQSQYHGMVHNKRTLIFPIIALIASAAVPIALRQNFAPLITEGVYALCACIGRREFKGFNGDVSGFSLTVSELAGLIMVMR